MVHLRQLFIITDDAFARSVFEISVSNSFVPTYGDTAGTNRQTFEIRAQCFPRSLPLQKQLALASRCVRCAHTPEGYNRFRGGLYGAQSIHKCILNNKRAPGVI